ncbi:MAG: gliding motility-associated ABC transporter substrate-binding protein GldG [Saprospiraceae bacterium]|nr:gliding motility-associated ABC transporter substrate-binding protein GldG [Saprospiraceae bacterium]
MKKSFINIALFIGILIGLNVIANLKYGHLDLTEDKRFTLSDPTKKLLNDLDEVVLVRVLLEGEFPAGFKRLQKATKDILEDFRSESGYIEYEFSDPNAGTVEEINQRRETLSKQGVNPVNLKVKDNDGSSEKLIYPYAIISYKNKVIPINLLEPEVPGVSPEVILNNSISLLEYKFANTISKAGVSGNKPNILFTEGNGELLPLQTKDLETELAPFYETGRINLDSIISLDPKDAAIVIVAKPSRPFSEKEKFILDQYVMKGGKVLWLIDNINANLDSLKGKKHYVAFPFELNLDDLLFKYGFRIQPDLVLDLQSTRIPQVVGQQGNNPQIELFQYFYHPVSVPRSNHPIVKGLEGVNLLFPSSIDTVKTKYPLHRYVLLESSQFSRTQLSPVRLDFEILRYEPKPEQFSKSYLPMAVLAEGRFASLYENRVSPAMMSGLKQLNQEFKNESEDTKMIVVSDGDVIRNLIDPVRQAYQPLGFNPYERYKFANKEFLMNCIEYLIDDNGIITARGKEVKLRMLNTVKAEQEETKWQIINVGLPVVLLILFGVAYHWWRRRRYSR